MSVIVSNVTSSSKEWARPKASPTTTRIIRTVLLTGIGCYRSKSPKLPRTDNGCLEKKKKRKKNASRFFFCSFPTYKFYLPAVVYSVSICPHFLVFAYWAFFFFPAGRGNDRVKKKRTKQNLTGKALLIWCKCGITSVEGNTDQRHCIGCCRRDGLAISWCGEQGSPRKKTQYETNIRP